MTRHREYVPGMFLLGVAPAIAACVLAFNVYFLRVHHPGAVSGKLSDLAINFLLPLLVVAGCEWLLAATSVLRGRQPCALPPWWRLVACVVSATYFSLLQIVPSFVELHAHVAAVLDLPFGGNRTFTRNVADLPDLMTLVTTLLAARYLGAVPIRATATVAATSMATTMPVRPSAR